MKLILTQDELVEILQAHFKTSGEVSFDIRYSSIDHISIEFPEEFKRTSIASLFPEK